MAYPRGYKLYEPLDHLNPNPLLDNLIYTFNEGVDYLVNDTNIIFTETAVNSNYINGGETEYRYFVSFDDENISNPSNVFSILNLMPPTNLSAQVLDYDEIQLTFTNAQFANGYKYSIKNLTSNITTEGNLNVNKMVVGLNDNTSYEIKIASVSSKNQVTEWTSNIQKTTMTLFYLSSNVSNKHIIWSWTHNSPTGKTVTRFDLINSNDNSVLFTGATNTYNQDSPVQRYNNIIRVTYNDSTTRDSKPLTSNVYSNDMQKFSLTDNTTHDYVRNAKYIDFDVYKDFDYSTAYLIDNFKTDSATDFTFKNTAFTNGSALCSYKLSLYNYRNDAWDFYQNSFTNGMFKVSGTSLVFQDYLYQKQLNLLVKNDFKDKYKLINNLYQNYKYQTQVKMDIFVDTVKPIYSKLTTYQAFTYSSPINLYILNNRTTPYGLKLNFYNSMRTDLTTGRQTIFNPIEPFGIDNVDTVFNATITNIDMQSQVNKVRILCVGDSITAGAPSYDPQYGGSTSMSDLITGKVITRNVKESCYPYWLQYRLGIDDFEVIDEGSGRRVSSDVYYHIEDQMEQYKPQYVIIMIGTNDIFQAQDSGDSNLTNTVNTALNNIRSTIDAVRKKDSIPVLGTQLPRNSIVPQEAKNALRNLNAGIKNLGIEYGLDVIDWYNVFVQKDSTGKENGVLRYDMTVDDTHPSITGYRLMAYTINLGIFNSFRATIRLFGGLQGNDVDYSKEETKIQPDPYTINYTVKFPDLRRLQRYVFSKYLKNTGNSWGLFVIQLSEVEDICEIWDEKNQQWVNTLVGQLAPNQIMELRIRYIIPSTGTNKEVDFNIDYIVKR